jgi:acyl dehydratase
VTSPTRFAFDTLSRGDVLPTVDLTVTHEDVRAYLDATGEPADRWGEHVPPVMLSALMLAALLGQVEIPKGVMHTGQEHESMRPVRIGEALTVTVLVSSHAVRRGALMAAFDAEARVGDEVVAISRASVLVPPPEDAAPTDPSNAGGAE